MRRILLKTETDDSFPPGSQEGAPIAYSDVIRQVIRRPLDQQKGADIEEMRKGIRILDALDRAQDNVLVLEDADWEHLKAKTLAMPWAMIDRRIMRFIDAVTDAEENVAVSEQVTNGQVKEPAAF